MTTAFNKLPKALETMEWYKDTEWEISSKGLHKRVLHMDFKELSKPHVLSTVIVSIKNVLNLEGRESNYLSDVVANSNVQIEMGTSLCPIDYYLEIFVQNMVVGETAVCTMKTKNSEDIVFTITLHKIMETKEIHKLTVSEMYQLALKYKENGVKIFKTYPLFAQDYFVRAAKCLISYKNFDPLTKEKDGMDGKDMQELMMQIHTNLAACLLNQQRYEDVIYHTEFVNKLDTIPPDKSVYRRAMAYYNLKEFESAQKTIEKIPNYKEKKDFLALHRKIQKSWKSSNDEYKTMVQKMFN